MQKQTNFLLEGQPTVKTRVLELETKSLEAVSGKAQGMDAAMRLNVLLKHTNCVFGFKLLNEYLRLVQILAVDQEGWIKVLARTEDGQILRLEVDQHTPFYFYPLFGK